MVRRCVLCFKASNTHKHLSFHRFPRDETRRSIWIDTLSIKEVVKDWHRVCSSHFSPDQYTFSNQRNILKLDAIPIMKEVKDKVESCETSLEYDDEDFTSNGSVDVDCSPEDSDFDIQIDEIVPHIYSSNDSTPSTSKRVPFHEALRSKKWTDAIGINEPRNKKYFICDKHFKSSEFDHNGVDVNVNKLKLSTVSSLSSPVIEAVNEEYEHRLNNTELSFDLEEIEVNDDDLSNENLPLNKNEMNDSISNEISPIKINDVTPKILSPQSLTSNQELLCVYCNRRENIMEAKQYYLQKLAEIKEEESKLPLFCPCENNENLMSNKQLMTPLDKWNYNYFSTLSQISLARRAIILDHSYTLTPSKIKRKN